MSWLRTDFLPMQMTPCCWQLFVSQQTDLLLLLPLRGTWLGFRSGAITGAWYRILKKTKALVISSSRTVSPPHGYLVLSGVSIGASPNLDILSLNFDSKLTFEDHVRGIVSRVSKRISIFGFVKRIFVQTSALLLAILHLFSNYLRIALRCVSQLLSITFSFLSARCIQWPGFVPIRISCRCVIDIM